ncbi:MAG TPA: hypothetical protein VMW63_03715 [Methanoregulaceae archaeon]|nr:hypothetical protein [Methanoregulaceae archaeon]
MKPILIGTFLLLFLLIIGCTTTSDSSQNFGAEPVFLEDNSNKISVSLDNITVKPRGTDAHDIIIYFTVENLGTEAVQLGATTRLIDYDGVPHAGTGIFFDLMYPGESSTTFDTISVTSDNYNALLKGATLYAYFADSKMKKYSYSKRKTYDVTWVINLNNQ